VQKYLWVELVFVSLRLSFRQSLENGNNYEDRNNHHSQQTYGQIGIHFICLRIVNHRLAGYQQSIANLTSGVLKSKSAIPYFE
jgi:hypothetical protein